jgi:hypothetical protein
MTQNASELLPVNASLYKLRRASGEVDLAARHRLLAEYMVHGTEHQRARRLGLPLNVPLTLEQAAVVLDIRRRNARQISRMPEFQGLMASLSADLRNGFKSRAIHRMGELVDWRGEGTAADATVALKASQAVLGEEAKGLSVNVNVANQTNVGIRPGYVLDLSALHGRRGGAPAPGTLDPEPTAPVDESE